MKRIGLFVLTIALALTAACSAPGNTPSGSAEVQTSAAQTSEGMSASVTASESAVQTPAVPSAAVMSVASSGIVNGVIDPIYGGNGQPKLSLPLEITGAPEGTVCFAVYMDDPDAVPVCGFRWVHWMAVNIEAGSIPEDFSRTAGDAAVQGANDGGTVGYAGPQPPDKDHTYVITVYALDAALSLTGGFTKEDFASAVEEHVLASAVIEGIYKKQ
jgi:Raf kinase inhibitor-like YbhB/YbcL family protein